MTDTPTTPDAPNEQPVALITGARRGIGKRLCEYLLDRDFVVVGMSRGEASWQRDGMTHVAGDVREEEDVLRIMRLITKRWRRLDVLINAAGVASMNHMLLTPMKTATEIVETNLLGPFVVCREAAKLMRRRGYGRIVNFGSAAVPLRLPGEAIYIAAKCGLTRLSEVMAQELADFGITVNVVAPAPVDTDMIRGIPKEKIDALLARMPIRRLTSLDDIINATEFFLRPESDAITGQVLYLGGVYSS